MRGPFMWAWKSVGYGHSWCLDFCYFFSHILHINVNGAWNFVAHLHAWAWHGQWKEKKHKIWISGYWGVLFWGLHFLVSATPFPKSNDTFDVAPWVLTLDIYLGEGCRLRQPSQAATLFPVENFMSPIYHLKGCLMNKTSPSMKTSDPQWYFQPGF